jgi:hypothetical protein
MMQRILNAFLGGKVKRRTRQYLDEIRDAPVRASREETRRVLEYFCQSDDPQILLGRTNWGEEVSVPATYMLAAHSLVTGGTGAGKTRFTLLIIKALINRISDGEDIGCGVVDPKGDLFAGTLQFLCERIHNLSQTNPDAAEALRRRVVILDFASRDPVSPYNILARWPSAEPGFFAASRADLLLDLLPGGDGLSLGASAVMRKCLLLLSEFDLPITWLNDLLFDSGLRQRLLASSENDEVKTYFARQFASAPKQTIAALSRRIDALFSSDGVRLALSGATAPDFRALQDDGKVVLINCFGQNICRSVRQLLQSIVVSDIAQSVFTRTRRQCFPWFCDEAQNFFLTARLRDHMHDLLTMSRSFGTFMCCLTQNLGSAIQDSKLLHSFSTNIRWSFSMRGEPSDCAFLRSVLPVTGRKLQPQTDPFKEPTYYTVNDERAMALNAIASLPDRTGYFWLREQSSEAINITTADVSLLSGPAADRLIEAAGLDSTFGARISRQALDDLLVERNRMWRAEPATDPEAEPSQLLADMYARTRGKPS